MKRIIVLLMVLLSVTGMAFAQEVGPVLQQSPVQEDLFSNIDASEMTEEEMVEVEGEWVVRALSGVISGAASAVMTVKREIDAGSSTKRIIGKGLISFGIGAAAGALTGYPVGVVKLFTASSSQGLY